MLHDFLRILQNFPKSHNFRQLLLSFTEILNTKTVPVSIYLFKVNNRGTRKRCGICLNLTRKTPERCHGCRSDVFVLNIEHISHVFIEYISHVFACLSMFLFAGFIITPFLSSQAKRAFLEFREVSFIIMTSLCIVYLTI